MKIPELVFNVEIADTPVKPLIRWHILFKLRLFLYALYIIRTISCYNLYFRSRRPHYFYLHEPFMKRSCNNMKLSYINTDSDSLIFSFPFLFSFSSSLFVTLIFLSV